MSDARLPDAWVDALFVRFRKVWGAMKFSATYRPTEGDDVTDWAEDMHELWCVQLGPYSGPTLRAALQAAIDEGRDWPPTLPEFKALCRQFNRPEHSIALPAPALEPTEEGRELLKRATKEVGAVSGFDPLHWAKYPASRKAVEFLVIGAESDVRLRAILAKHLADPERATVRENHPRADEARKALRELAGHPPAWLKAA